LGICSMRRKSFPRAHFCNKIIYFDLAPELMSLWWLVKGSENVALSCLLPLSQRHSRNAAYDPPAAL
jgi:hypothetical protein